MTNDDIADRLMQLINSKPYSPRKDEILAVLNATEFETEKLMGRVRPYFQTPHMPPHVRVEANGIIVAQGWSFDPKLPPQDAMLAVLAWLRDAALQQRTPQ